MGDVGQCGVSWRYVDMRDGVVALWTYCVEWEGEDSDGDLWEESWVSVTHLSKDLREEARKLEGELFGPRGTRAPSRRASRREEVRRRQERERDAQQWRARLRDRARGA